ncbi:hypothetical protein V496_03602 [Pseudogymnoascus sp. VKM F-4515 (FW-2607)]|nr:hypothetical protein V496_03602 [Pseudogymnoascus sp. VKM F-4515 (FW-2607)]KFY94750.1 hypothetical protein V498_03749 [Pseudogymnoascus sp. VKM F-4517 (FW-2822)]
MKGSVIRSVSVLFGAASLFGTANAALQPVIIKGSKFFYTNGTQFFIKGVAYQQGVGAAGESSGSSSDVTYQDPLSNTAACQRDVPLLEKLGANVIRTYAIDPTADHTACMKLLDDAGIYVISDLGQPNLSINRETPEWNLDLYDRYTSVVDSLSKYSNVIGYFAGNEVTSNSSYTPASAFVKAAIRDTKAYIKKAGYSTPVGYAADDDAGTRARVAAYFNCGDAADTIDFWGYNIYSWCDPSTYVTSGYKNHTETFASYNVPVFFAEYGCNEGSASGDAPRVFNEVAALYGTDMSKVFSGGIVYEFFQETNDYGLVSLSGTTVTKLKDYDNFSTKIHAVTPSAINSASYSPTNTAGQACPTVNDDWKVAATGLPPTPNKSVCTCMTSSLKCVAKPNLPADDLPKLFSSVCGLSSTACSGFASDTAKGVYGAYLGCSDLDKLSNAFNAYYLEQDSADTACDFGGSASLVAAPSAASSCGSIIASATGAVSTGTADSGSGSDSGDGSSDKSAASSVIVGGWGMGAWITAMVVSVAGLVVL